MREAWRTPLLLCAVVLVAILLVYRDTAVAMVEIWNRSETFTHAFVVPPIAAWLIWRQRWRLAPLQPRVVGWMLAPMAGLALLWWLGDLANVAAAKQFALVALLVCTAPLMLGWQVSRAIAFPLLFLFFAVPIGEFLTPTLMHWTANALVTGLRWTGIPVYQEGQQLVIPSGRWAVVEACGGIRYLMATFMVGSLFAYLNYRGMRKRLTFVAVSLILPVLANWVRAYIIVMLGHLSNNEIATGVDHLVYGWVFFGVVVLALFFVGARWADADDPAVAPSPDTQAAGLSAPPGAVWRPLLLGCAAVAIVAWPAWHAQRDHAHSVTAPARLVLPPTLGAWRASAAPTLGWQPHFPGAALQPVQAYAGPGGTVTVHVAYYRGQAADRKLVSSVNGFIDAEPWHLLGEGEAVSTVDGRAVTWRRATLTTTEGATIGGMRPHLTVWRLYWLGGPLSHRDSTATLLQAWNAARGEPDDGAAIHLVATDPDEQAANRLLAAFVHDNFNILQQVLVQARDGR